MVVVRVVVHPQGLGPKEAGKAWYSAAAILKPKQRTSSSNDVISISIFIFALFCLHGPVNMIPRVFEEEAEAEMESDPRHGEERPRQKARK